MEGGMDGWREGLKWSELFHFIDLSVKSSALCSPPFYFTSEKHSSETLDICLCAVSDSFSLGGSVGDVHLQLSTNSS